MSLLWNRLHAKGANAVEIVKHNHNPKWIINFIIEIHTFLSHTNEIGPLNWSLLSVHVNRLVLNHIREETMMMLNIFELCWRFFLRHCFLSCYNNNNSNNYDDDDKDGNSNGNNKNKSSSQTNKHIANVETWSLRMHIHFHSEFSECIKKNAWDLVAFSLLTCTVKKSELCVCETVIFSLL